MWPRPPIRVTSCRVRGQLHDLGPYPALLPGTDWVLGELWELAPHDIAETLRVLDEIEGFRRRDDDLYRREVIECTTEEKGKTLAFTYYFVARPGRATRIKQDETGVCAWRAKPNAPESIREVR